MMVSAVEPYPYRTGVLSCDDSFVYYGIVHDYVFVEIPAILVELL